MASVFRYAIKQVAGEAAETSATTAFRKNIMADAIASMGDKQQAQIISQALNLSGNANIPKASFLSEIDNIPEEALEKSLVKTAQTNPDEFAKVMKQLHSGDDASQVALRKFYKANPDLQVKIKSAIPNADTFFRNLDELSPAQRKAATKKMAEPNFAKADGGRLWFGKVWDSMTVKNLESATGAARNIGALGLTVGFLWTVMSVISFLSGKDMLEIFSDFFEFVKNPAGSLFDGEKGDWTLTPLGKMAFGTAAVFGIAVTVKLFNTVKGD
tara:strand:+ start:595 stop:1407 length:813 start_codon:yes stop_codon:yes gene_type:complete